MKKIIFSIVVFVFAISFQANAQGGGWYSGGSTSSNATLTKGNTTKITWDEQSKDLGTLKQYSQTEVKFIMKNVGDKPVVILDAQKSCGCTSVDFPRKPVMPGKTAVITVSYDAEDVGVFTKDVTLSFSEGTPQQVLHFQGEVVK